MGGKVTMYPFRSVKKGKENIQPKALTLCSVLPPIMDSIPFLKQVSNSLVKCVCVCKLYLTSHCDKLSKDDPRISVLV